MTNFDSIVTVGASWAWGSELPSQQRTELRFDNVLATKLGIDSVINIARESATPFCYKWHWIDWLDSKPTCSQPLVLIQLTNPGRHLIYDNQADWFQESPGRLISEKMVLENWGNGPKTGGFVRANPTYVDFPSSNKERVRSNFYRYNHDDKMGEIYDLWEIKLMDLMIKEFGGYPLFWADDYSYNVTLPWAQDLLKNVNLLNNLLPLFAVKNLKHFDNLPSFSIGPKEQYIGPGDHPNPLGHEYIAERMHQFLIEKTS